MALEYTGERFIPEKTEQDAAEHWARYRFALSLVHDKVVLDVGCGAGYGSQLLASQAAFIYAVDIEPEAVKHAHTHHCASNLRYQVANATLLPLPSHCVDLAVAFEVIEHLARADQHAFMREVQRLLRSPGLFVVSTPDKELFGEGCNPFHRHEFSKKEFYQFLSKFFPVVELYGQHLWRMRGQRPLRVLRQSLRWLVAHDKLRLRKRFLPDMLRANANRLPSDFEPGVLSQAPEPRKLLSDQTGIFLVAVCYR